MPLGLEDRRIPNPVMRASSHYNYYCGPWNARLNQRRAGRNGGAWCSKRRDRAQWLRVDFGGLTRVTRIATQGRQNSDQWVTSYYMSYSRKGRRYTPYREKRRTKVCSRGRQTSVSVNPIRSSVPIIRSLSGRDTLRLIRPIERDSHFRVRTIWYPLWVVLVIVAVVVVLFCF